MWQTFVMNLLYSGFCIEYSLHNTKRRIHIKTQSSVDIIIEDYPDEYYSLLCRFIGHKELTYVGFVFDMNNFDAFIEQLKTDLLLISKEYATINLNEFSNIEG